MFGPVTGRLRCTESPGGGEDGDGQDDSGAANSNTVLIQRQGSAIPVLLEFRNVTIFIAILINM